MLINSLELDTRSYQVRGCRFEVPEQYTLLEPVAHGAYGIVCAALDKASSERVAVKKIEGAFDTLSCTKRTLRELRLLRHLRHENLAGLQSIFFPGSREGFGDIYVVSELMATDLALILKSPQQVTDDHCQFFLYQILRGMKYVHSAQVIHCDLKPRNLLVNANCDLKISEFGQARFRFADKEFQISEWNERFVCTRWYRAPEVLCSWVAFSKAIDIWSIGCVFAEMLVRSPLFPAPNTPSQLQAIVSFLGTPGEEQLHKIPNDKCRRFIQSLPSSTGKPFEDVCVGASRTAIDFLGSTIQFAPDERATVDQALQHPYMVQLYCPEDEPIRPPLDTSGFEFERRKISMAALHEEVFAEVMHYFPDMRELYTQELAMTGKTRAVRKCRLLVLGESQYSSSDDSGGP